MLHKQYTQNINGFIKFALAICENFNNLKYEMLDDPNMLIAAIRAFNTYMMEEHNDTCSIYDQEYPPHQEKLRDWLNDDELSYLKESGCRYCLVTTTETPIPISAETAVGMIQGYAYRITTRALLNPIALTYSWWYKTFFLDVVNNDSELSNTLTLTHK